MAEGQTFRTKQRKLWKLIYVLLGYLEVEGHFAYLSDNYCLFLLFSQISVYLIFVSLVCCFLFFLVVFSLRVSVTQILPHY